MVASLQPVVLLAMSDHELQYNLAQSATEHDKLRMRISASNFKYMTLSVIGAHFPQETGRTVAAGGAQVSLGP